MTTAQVHFRIDSNEKKVFDDIFEAMGINSTEAYKIFIRKTVETGGFPFELNKPNTRLQKSINSDNYTKFQNTEAGLNYLMMNPQSKDHALVNRKPERDLHIKPDWILIYKYDGEYIKFIDTGTHSDLF